MKRRAPKVEAKPVEKPEEPLPETKEGVIEDMVKLCDDVDARMTEEAKDDRRAERNFRSYWQQTQPWRGFHDRRDDLTSHLREMLDDDTDLGDYVREHLAAPGGQIPSFARPGFFVLWIDFIPIGCAWEGFIVPKAATWALDPNSPWINEEGQRWLDDKIDGNATDVEEVFRRRLTEWTTQTTHSTRGGRGRSKGPSLAFQPVSLTPHARRVAGALLEGMPWLRPILQRGPVNPIRMPPHVKSVQLALA